MILQVFVFFFQAEDGIRDIGVTGVQTCALPISVRRTPSYALYRSPLREETHPSFKVDTQKNLWIDYAEGRGGSIIDLCMRRSEERRVGKECRSRWSPYH